MWYSQYPWNPFLLYFLIALISYLLGGINGSLIVSKTIYKKDIRNFGSGNAGLTNFNRVFGKSMLILVFLIDFLKTALPVIFAGCFMGLSGKRVEGCALSCFFVMLGNSYPPYYGFKGGKTVMALGAAIFFVDWRVGLVMGAAFLLLVALTRYVSLGSVVGGALYPVFMRVFGNTESLALLMATLSAALLIYRHRANIKRLFKGTESKLSFSK